MKYLIIFLFCFEAFASNSNFVLVFHGFGHMYDTKSQYEEFVPGNEKYIKIFSEEFGFDVGDFMVRLDKDPNVPNKLETVISQMLIYKSLEKFCPEIVSNLQYITAHSYGENLIPLVEHSFRGDSQSDEEEMRSYAKFIHEIIDLESEFESKLKSECWLDVVRGIPLEKVQQTVDKYLEQNPGNFLTIAGSLRKDYTSIVGTKEAVTNITSKLNKPGYNPAKPFLRNCYMHSAIMQPIVKPRAQILKKFWVTPLLNVKVINDHDGSIITTKEDLIISMSEKSYLVGHCGASEKILKSVSPELIVCIGGKRCFGCERMKTLELAKASDLSILQNFIYAN